MMPDLTIEMCFHNLYDEFCEVRCDPEAFWMGEWEFNMVNMGINFNVGSDKSPNKIV
jgi:hypothetical protein